MPLRLLVGVIGLAASGAGAMVAVTELRVLTLRSPPILTALAALFSGVVVWGGALLVRAAIRGRIAVRRPRARRPRR